MVFSAFLWILRAIPDKLFGVLAMGGAIVSFALPWLEKIEAVDIDLYGSGVFGCL